MSLVSGFISGITSSGIGGSNAASLNYGFDDNSFSDLLEKQMNVKADGDANNINMLGSLGMPAGMQIDGIDFSEKVQDQMEALGEEIKTEYAANNANPFDMNKDGNVTLSETADFFTTLLDNDPAGQNARSGLYNYAKQQATNFYSKYSGNVVTNLSEFVNDIKELIS